MVGSTFILINKNGSRNLLNTAQITYVGDKDVRLTDTSRKLYSEFLPEQEMAYCIVVEFTDGRPKEYLFDNKEERDATLAEFIAALSPSLTIDSPAGLPLSWPEIARQEPKPRPTSTNPDEMTLEELRPLAMAQLKHLQEQAALAAAMQAAPPTPKPARKPYTRQK